MPAKAGVSLPSSTSGSAKTDVRSTTQADRLPLIGPHFYVGSIAGLPDPVLKTFFRFALADGDLGLHPVAVGGHVLLAPLLDFDQMPAERCAYRRRYLVEGELVHRFLERGHDVPGIDPAEVAAFGRAWALGIELRQ